MNIEEAKAELERQFGEFEELDPELAAYLEEDEETGITSLRHPLVYSIFHQPLLNAMVNKMLKAKQDSLERVSKEEDWHTYVYLHERPYRLDAFGEIYGLMDDATYWKLLGQIWVDSENIWQNEEEWISYLTDIREDRFNSIMSDADRQDFALLPETFTVYRGFCKSGRERGLSWTTDKIRAKWFARRLCHEDDDVPMLAQATITKDQVIAHFVERNESEIVWLPGEVEIKLSEVKPEEGL